MPREFSHNQLRLSVVSPCYNEEDVIEAFYTELKRVLITIEMEHEIIIVDDGSTDNTLLILNKIAEKDRAVKVYSFSRNFGHQIALTAGLNVVGGDAVVMLDSDMQHPPSLIPEMIEKWKADNEIVSAVRKNTKGVSLAKRLSSKAFYKLINFLSDIEIPEGAADFCLLSRKAYTVLRSMPETHRFLRGMISWMGMKRSFISYVAPERLAGKSKYSFFKMLSLAIEATISFSSFPLKLATRMGLFITSIGGCYFIWILLRYFLVGGLVSGWGSLICVSLILGGAQLIFMGIIGQYLLRVFEEAKQRPLYIFKQQPEDSNLGKIEKGEV